MSRSLISDHKCLISVWFELLSKGGRTLASRDPLVDGLLLIIEEPLDDDQALVIAVLKVAVEDDAGGREGARTVRLRRTDGIYADAPNVGSY